MVLQQSESTPPADKYYFLIRRLHSLSGLVPVGVFLCFHLFANATILAPGPDGQVFQQQIERIHALGPFLVPVEILGIFLPLLFHILVGVQILLAARSNAQEYRFGPNIRYTLQRITGMLALAFILYHVWQLHWLGAKFGGGAFALHDSADNPTGAITTAAAIRSAWWVAPIYAVGMLSCVFHFANGVWTSLITWGITIRPRTQRVSGYVCAVLGVVLSIAGLGALSGFRTLDLDAVAVPAGGSGSTHAASAADSGS